MPADGDYLVGDRFSVANLTAASLFAPVVSPPRARTRRRTHRRPMRSSGGR